jgi:hypothetical protein
MSRQVPTSSRGDDGTGGREPHYTPRQYRLARSARPDGRRGPNSSDEHPPARAIGANERDHVVETYVRANLNRRGDSGVQLKTLDIDDLPQAGGGCAPQPASKWRSPQRHPGFERLAST